MSRLPDLGSSPSHPLTLHLRFVAFSDCEDKMAQEATMELMLDPSYVNPELAEVRLSSHIWEHAALTFKFRY
jgi:hypothetical protein